MSPVDALLGATDLDTLALARHRLGDPAPDERSRLAAALDQGDPGRSNVLMYPAVLPVDVRLDALADGLREGPASYAALAATVGLAGLDGRDVPTDRRSELVGLLLDLVEEDTGVVAVRAAAALRPILPASEAGEAVPLLAHPTPEVRRNLLAAILTAVGPAALRSLLDSPGFVDPDAADDVRRHLAQDGVRLDDGLEPPLPALPLLPDREQWDG